MAPDDVFPAEMPERGPALIDALDENTVERLVRGRVGPDDAPPGYAEVARVLQAAAEPAGPDEPAGRESAMASFRAHLPDPTARHRPPGRARGRVRARVVALAVAGVVAAGGLWTAADAPSPPGLPSHAGAPKSGGAGSGAPGLVTQARPLAPPVTGAGARASARALTGDPSTRDGGGGTASRASGHGAKEHRPGKPPKPKPAKSEPGPKAKDKPKPEHQR